MKVDKRSWHAKLYLWWYRQKYGREKVSGNTNLCPYMRAVLFWSWLRFLFFSGRVGRVPLPAILWSTVALTWPLSLRHLGGQWWIPYLIYAAIVGFMGVVWTILSVYERLRGKRIVPEQVTKFGELLKAYGESAHTRVCPEIELK